MRRLLLAAACIATLASCSPPAQETSQAPAAEVPPVTAACNALEPDLANAVTLEGEVAVAAAVADLRGGRITPGTYDLASGNRIGGAAGWQGARAMTLDVNESDAGAMFDWASAAPGGEVERWTAGFTEAPSPRLTYTCGRSGGADVAFTAEPNGLRLRVTEDGETGSLYLVFVRRN